MLLRWKPGRRAAKEIQKGKEEEEMCVVEVVEISGKMETEEVETQIRVR